MVRSAAFRIAYTCYAELRDDVARQMAYGGVVVKVAEAHDLTLDAPVALELVLPDGRALRGAGRVLQVFTGVGVAVSVDAELVAWARDAARRSDDLGVVGSARHERIDDRTQVASPRAARSTTRPPPLGPGATASRTASATPPLGSGAAASATRPLGPGAAASATRPPPLASGSSPQAWPPHDRPAAPPPVAAGSSPHVWPPRDRPAAAPPPAAAGSSPDTWSSRERPGSSTPVAAGAPAAARSDGPSRLEKVQKALHGTRDERNAILRDRDRTLHPFVLKNPQLDAEDVLAIAKNAQMAAELLQQIGDRKEWLQRPAVALALARNPRTPPELAVRALEHVPIESLRQMAKGTGAPPHVTQAARKKLLG